MLRLPAHRPAVCPPVRLNPVTEAYDGMSDMFDVVDQLVESAEPFDISLEEEALVAVEVDDDFVWVADLETEVRLFEFWLSAVEALVVVEEDEEEQAGEEFADEEQAELPFAPLVEVPRDFFVGGSSRELLFIEFRLPWDGLLLFSFLERLLDDDDVPAVDDDWLEGVGELFTGALRRKPIIVALAILSFACLRATIDVLFTVISQSAHRH